MIEIISKTLKFINKEKNGDHFIHELLDEHVLIAAVADGVSQQPCDWKASQVACEQLLEQFKILEGLPLDDRLRESIIHANDSVIAEESDCRKMSTTLSAVCLDMKGNQAYWGNIGDSRIYQVRSSEILQLTNDDTLKRTKTILTSVGRRNVDASILTKSLGMETSFLDIQIHPLSTEPGDLLVLATDGFYSARLTFEQNMIALSNSGELQSDFNTTFKKYGLLAGDDMTALVIRT